MIKSETYLCREMAAFKSQKRQRSLWLRWSGKRWIWSWSVRRKIWRHCQGLLGSEGGARSHPHLQIGEYVYHIVLAQNIHDAFSECMHGLQHRMLLLV